MEYNLDKEEEVIKLKNAMQYQNDEDVKVIDTNAKTEDDLQPNYLGKYIAQCNICGQLIYRDTMDLTEIEACPYCGFDDCFVLIGQVKPITQSTFIDDLKQDGDAKQFDKSELVYGEAVPTEE